MYVDTSKYAAFGLRESNQKMHIEIIDKRVHCMYG